MVLCSRYGVDYRYILYTTPLHIMVSHNYIQLDIDLNGHILIDWMERVQYKYYVLSLKVNL